jgi:hypothetical protein
VVHVVLNTLNGGSSSSTMNGGMGRGGSGNAIGRSVTGGNAGAGRTRGPLPNKRQVMNVSPLLFKKFADTIIIKKVENLVVVVVVVKAVRHVWDVRVHT